MTQIRIPDDRATAIATTPSRRALLTGAAKLAAGGTLAVALAPGLRFAAAQDDSTGGQADAAVVLQATPDAAAAGQVAADATVVAEGDTGGGNQSAQGGGGQGGGQGGGGRAQGTALPTVGTGADERPAGGRLGVLAAVGALGAGAAALVMRRPARTGETDS